MGLAIIHSPTSDNRIYIIDDLLEGMGNFALGLQSYLLHESFHGLLRGNSIDALSIDLLGELAF